MSAVISEVFQVGCSAGSTNILDWAVANELQTFQKVEFLPPGLVSVKAVQKENVCSLKVLIRALYPCPICPDPAEESGLFLLTAPFRY